MGAVGELNLIRLMSIEIIIRDVFGYPPPSPPPSSSSFSAPSSSRSRRMHVARDVSQQSFQIYRTRLQRIRIELCCSILPRARFADCRGRLQVCDVAGYDVGIRICASCPWPSSLFHAADSERRWRSRIADAAAGGPAAAHVVTMASDEQWYVCVAG